MIWMEQRSLLVRRCSTSPGGLVAVAVPSVRDADLLLAALFNEVRGVPEAGVLALRAALCRSEGGWFREVSAVLQFPLYFGKNWDAFRDSLFDNRTKYERLVLVIVDAGKLLEEEAPEKLAWLLQDLRELAGEPRERTSELPQRTIVFLDEADALKRLAERFGEELIDASL